MASSRTSTKRDAPPDGGAGSHDLADRLIAVMRLLRSSSSRSEVAGLSNARYELLHTLIHSGPVRMGTAARQLGISPRTMTPMVDALEADGLLRRDDDPSDRRAQVLTLTSAGVAVMRRAHDERIAIAGRIFAPLTSTEQGELSALLGKLIAAAADGAPS